MKYDINNQNLEEIQKKLKEAFIFFNLGLKKNKNRLIIKNKLDYLINFLEGISKNEDYDLEKSYINLLDLNLVNNVLSLKEEKDIIEFEFQISAVLGVVGYTNFNDYYKSIELVRILDGTTKDYDKIKYFYSLNIFENISKENQLVRRAIVDSLKGEMNNQDIEKYSWEEKFDLKLKLDFLLKSFSRLSEMDKIFFFKNCFFKSIVLGVPIREKILDEFLNINYVFEYFILDKRYYDYLSMSNETFLYEDKPYKIRNLFGLYLKKAGEDYNNLDKINNFVKTELKIDSLGKDNHLFIVEILDIYLRLKQADLVGWLKEHNETEKQLYDTDILKLTMHFVLDNNFEYSVKYFTNKDSKIKINFFLVRMKEIIDLKDNEMLERLIKMIEVLKKNSVLDGVSDIIYFDEESGEFKWNLDNI